MTKRSLTATQTAPGLSAVSKDIERRRARVARMSAKRPRIVIEVERVPDDDPTSRERFYVLILELLDKQRRSGAP